MSLPKPLNDAELEKELNRIVEVIQATRLAIFDDRKGGTLPVDHPKRQLWLDLLDVEYYALESLQDMGCAV